MSKGTLLKMNGSICNIPVTEVDVNGNMLPRQAHSNWLLIVNRNLEYKSHVVFEELRPALVLQFLELLKSHNHFCSDIESNPSNSPVDILGCQNDHLE